MSEKELPVVKVGDMLAFRYGNLRPRYKLCRVMRITPSGRIVCGIHTLDPDLRIRGRVEWSAGPDYAQVVTPEITEAMERQGLVDRAIRRITPERLYGLPIEKLRELNKLVVLNEGQK